MKKLCKINAFTLAEVLLTLVVVGVISVLTVPTLKNHADEAKYVAATQKAMSEIAAATSNAELAYGEASNWNFNSSTTANYYKKTMNTVPFPKGSKTSWDRNLLSGPNASFNPKFMTADGMAWEIHDGGYACGGGVALVDINGSAPPNTVGIDIQGFRIGSPCSSDGKKTGDFGIYAMGDGKNDANQEWACTAYIIRNKKMPWLYTPIDSCKTYVGK